jgi:hypothetical protein
MQDVSDEAFEAEVEKAEKEPREMVNDSASLLRLLYLIAGATLISLIFLKLQFATASVCCGDFDGYYHIRWSRLLWESIRQGQFPPTFIWLPLTTLEPRSYVDHHLLFHILQIPFTWFFELRLAAKIAAVIFTSIAVFSCYCLIVRYRINYALLWLVALLACSAPFLYRLSMAKAPPLAIIFTVIGIYLLFEKKYLWLAPLAFLFAWTYSLFVMLCAAAVIWSVVMAWSEHRFEWRPVVWTVVGTLAGFVINPYFPRNIWLFIAHFKMKVTPLEFSTSVGTEWYPYESWYFLGSCFVAFAAMLVGYISFNWSDKRASARPLFFLAFSTLLMIASFRSRRFVEYWPPFAVLFAAFSFQAVLERARSTLGQLPEEVLEELQPFLDHHSQPKTLDAVRQRERWKTAAATFIALVIGVILFFNIRETINSIKQDHGPDHYRRGMEWVRQNVPPGQPVFNTDWDDFPKMFFYDTTHTYASGLDPTYLLYRNSELSKLYEDITLGREKDPGPLIRERFGARYVFSDNEEVHNDFYFNALQSGWFERVYEDEECTVLYIRDQKGTPPPEAKEDETDEGVEIPPEDSEK